MSANGRVHKFEMHLSSHQYILFASSMEEAFGALEASHFPRNHEVGFSSTYSGFTWQAVIYSEDLQSLMELVGNISILLPSGALNDVETSLTQQPEPFNPTLETPEETVLDLPAPPTPKTPADAPDPEEDDGEDEDEEQEEEDDGEEDEDEEEQEDDDSDEADEPAQAQRVFKLKNPKSTLRVAPGVAVEEF